MQSETPTIPRLTSVADTIFTSIAAEKQVTDEQLATLHFLFDKHFAKAVQIVDQGGVFGFTGERSGRRVFQVKGRGSSDAYTVVPASYCACHNFFFDVASKSEALYCKHQLAVSLAEALGKTRNTTVSDLAVAEVLQS